MLAAKPINYPMDPTRKTSNFSGVPLHDPSQYILCLIGRLIYLTITRPYITYDVNRLSQFVTNPIITHLQPANHLLKFLKINHGQGFFNLPRRFVSSFCIFLGSIDNISPSILRRQDARFHDFLEIKEAKSRI